MTKTGETARGAKKPGGGAGAEGAGTPDAMTEALSNLTRMQAAALGPLHWMGPAGMEAFTATVREMSEFVSRRMAKDLDTQRALLESKTLEEVQQVQTRALTEAFDDYRVESERLAEIARHFVETAASLPETGRKD
jgi:hypothetical protein